MSDPINLDEHRGKGKNPPEERAALYMCDCGTSHFHIWTDGNIECVNCRSVIAMRVIED